MPRSVYRSIADVIVYGCALCVAYIIRHFWLLGALLPGLPYGHLLGLSLLFGIAVLVLGRLVPTWWGVRGLAVAFTCLLSYFAFSDIAVFSSRLFYLLFLAICAAAFWLQANLNKKVVGAAAAWLDRSWVDAAVAVGLGCVGLYFYTTLGLTYLPDSTTYLHTAHRLFFNHQLEQVPLWPPGYPVFISLLMPLFPFPGDAAAVLSGILLIAILITFTCILRIFSGSFWVRAFFLLLLASFRPFHSVFEAAHSESVFALLAILVFLLLFLHSRAGELRYLVGAALLSGMAAFTRYAGIALLLSTALYALTAGVQKKTLRSTFSSSVFALAVASLPLGLWFLRNQLVYGSLAGSSRITTAFDFASSSQRVFSTLWGDLGLAYVLLAGFAMAMLAWWWTKGKLGTEEKWLISLAALMFIPYLGFLILSAAVSPVDIDTRFFSPFYFILFVLLALSINRLLREKLWLAGLVFVPLVYLSFLQVQRVNTVFERLLPDRLTGLENHMQGFNAGPTARDLAVRFESIFAHKSNVAVNILLDDGNHFASTFFFRASVLPNNASQFDFEVLDDTEYQVNFVLDGQNKQLTYQHIDSLDEFTLASGTTDAPFMLIVSDGWMRQNAMTAEETAELALWGGITADYYAPYWVYTDK